MIFKFKFTMLLSLCVAVGGLNACVTSNTQRVDIKRVYDKAAQYHLPDRNPIIVIPGILGSKLVDDDTGTTVWGAFRSDYADPKTIKGAQLISLPIDPNSDIVHGHVRPDGVLENLELKLAGFPVTIQAYKGILTTLGAGGYTDQSIGLNSIDYGGDHFTCFQFDYDWRQDISYNAVQLKKFIDERRAYVKEQYRIRYGVEDADVKFDIAAHSMGGVLTRYFLRYGGHELPEDDFVPEVTWAGAQDVERAVLIAPPNAGSLDAFEQLIDGFNVGRPILPYYSPQILGTFPSVYQLLPRNRHKPLVWDRDLSKPVEDLYDPNLWQKYDWGLNATNDEAIETMSKILPHLDNQWDRQRVSAEFQARALRRAKQFHKAIDQPATPPESLGLYLVAGDAIEVPQTYSLNSETGELEVLVQGVGDKTVLRSSALLDERVGGEWKPAVQTPIDWKSVLFVPSEHRTITSDPVFSDNVLYWLLEDPR